MGCKPVDELLYCTGLGSVYNSQLSNSRPIPQTSAHQLTIEFIPMTRFIIVVTENYSDMKVSAASRGKKVSDITLLYI